MTQLWQTWIPIRGEWWQAMCVNHGAPLPPRWHSVCQKQAYDFWFWRQLIWLSHIIQIKLHRTYDFRSLAEASFLWFFCYILGFVVGQGQKSSFEPRLCFFVIYKTISGCRISFAVCGNQYKIVETWSGTRKSVSTSHGSTAPTHGRRAAPKGFQSLITTGVC